MSDSSFPSVRRPGPEWFEEIAELNGLVFFVLRIRPDVAFEYLGAALHARLGIPVGPGIAVDTEAVLGRIDPESAGLLAATLTMEPGQKLAVDLKWRHIDGHTVSSRGWIRATSRADGSVVQEGVVLDITELRDTEAELRQSEQRSRLLAENAYDVIWTMGLDGTVTYVSPAVERVRGFTPAEAIDQTIEEINPPESASRVLEYYQRVFAAIEAAVAQNPDDIACLIVEPIQAEGGDHHFRGEFLRKLIGPFLEKVNMDQGCSRTVQRPLAQLAAVSTQYQHLPAAPDRPCQFQGVARARLDRPFAL